jgi:hypothetical protein
MHGSREVRRFLRTAAIFAFVGLLLYLGVYAISEQLIARYGLRNRFFMVKTAPHAEYDTVILGASHAAVFDYDDMNARLERMTQTRILNLSVVGGGVTVNRLLLDYFLMRHRTGRIVYVLDSFVFYSREWNEDRLQDSRLFARAPFDPDLARLLLRNPASRSVGLDYAIGFSKINNPDRFKTDMSDEEATRFDRTYRPVKQIDQQRLEYLYPPRSPEEAASSLRRYLLEFEALIQSAQAQGIRVLVIKPPLPERVYRTLPGERQFDDQVRDILARRGVNLLDFSLVDNDERFFYNTDHLNRDGVVNFFQNHLKDSLK